MKRKEFGEKPTARGTKPYAGVAAFDAALVKRFRAIEAKAPTGALQSEAFGEAGPAPVEPRLPRPFQRGDDDAA
jgi:hypothetical protein